MHFSIAKYEPNYDERMICITGGTVSKNKITRSTEGVLIFNVETNELKDGPKMITARHNHSSTVTGTTLAVFGG